MKMYRKPTYSGKIKEKDELDILFWAIEKTALERLQESWRMHCINHSIDPVTSRLDKNKSFARKRL